MNTFLISLMLLVIFALIGFIIWIVLYDKKMAVIITITAIYSIIAIITSFFVPYYVAKEDSNSYVSRYTIEKATIEESLKSETLTGLERVELVKQATEINAGLAEKKYVITKWYGFYLNKEIENLEYINFATNPINMETNLNYIPLAFSTNLTNSTNKNNYNNICTPTNHLLHRVVITKYGVKATCTTTGLTYELKCGDCGKLLATQRETPIDPNNHDYVSVVTEPTCLTDGYTTHTCSRCGHNYIDANVTALGHTEVIDEGKESTFDEIGLTEGKHCSVCGKILVPQTVIPRKQEEITFTYEATGINGSDNAVNSGFITLKVYMNVNTEIARLWAADIDIKYSDFLALISVDGCILEQSLNTPFDIANNDCDVKFIQDMGYDIHNKIFTKGTYLFSTLTFKVNDDSYYKDALFKVVYDECKIVRNNDMLENELIVDFGNGAQIRVNMLGDADGDGKITSSDNLLLSKWFAYADLDSYDTVYDMNKDGYVDGDDFALLRGIIVKNNNVDIY